MKRLPVFLIAALVTTSLAQVTPNQALQSATAFQGVTDRNLEIISAYSLSVLALGVVSPSAALSAAAAWQGLDDHSLSVISAYSLAQLQSTSIANTNGSGTNNSFYKPTNYGGTGYTNTFFGTTNYYDATLPGNPANTNGPTVNFRQGGAIPILWNDTQVGSAAAYIQSFSTTFEDLTYGYFTLNTTHNGSPPSGGNTEWVWTFPSHAAFLIGAANAAAGHLQFGHLPANGFGGYAGSVGGNGNNAWINMQPAQFLSQSSATSFSLAIGFQTHELQGAVEVGHVPGILSYSTRTNAPGRWKLMFTGDLGNNGGETYDANTAKPQRVFEITSGDLTNAIFFKPINYPTNLGTVVIDCSIPVSDQTQAGGTLTFTAPINFDSTAKQYEHIYMFVTNSAVGALTLAPPTNGRLDGTLTVTRQAQVEWWIKIGFWTNGVVTQWF